jgi:hypothetical protein
MISSSWAVWMSKGVDFPGNIVEVVMLAYTVIHGCDPNKYKPGEIVEILPSDPKASPEWRMSVRPGDFRNSVACDHRICACPCSRARSLAIRLLPDRGSLISLLLQTPFRFRGRSMRDSEMWSRDKFRQSSKRRAL